MGEGVAGGHLTTLFDPLDDEDEPLDSQVWATLQHSYDDHERLLSVLGYPARYSGSSVLNMSLRTWNCIYWDRRWATFAVEVEDKVGVVARSLEEEGVRREEYRAVVMLPV